MRLFCSRCETGEVFGVVVVVEEVDPSLSLKLLQRRRCRGCGLHQKLVCELLERADFDVQDTP